MSWGDYDESDYIDFPDDFSDYYDEFDDDDFVEFEDEAYPMNEDDANEGGVFL